MTDERFNFIVNGILFQICWFACVLGGANGILWPAILSFAALAIFQLRDRRRAHNDVKLMVSSFLLALIVDTTWIQLGWLQYSTPTPLESITPIWIVLLWMGFAITLNHSLAWLKRHWLLPPLLGAMGGPLSYWAGLRIGAVSFHANPILITLCLAAAWASSMFILNKINN